MRVRHGSGASDPPRLRAMSLEPKVCPECRAEFVHTALACSDCGADLVLASEVHRGLGGAGRPMPGDLVLLRAEGPAWIEALGERLEDAGIPCWTALIDPERAPGRAGACALHVRTSDIARAREIDAALEHEQIPDLADLRGPAGEGAAHPGPGPSAGDEADEACPACGAGLGAPGDEAPECPDCGLFFG